MKVNAEAEVGQVVQLTYAGYDVGVVGKPETGQAQVVKVGHTKLHVKMHNGKVKTVDRFNTDSTISGWRSL